MAGTETPIHHPSGETFCLLAQLRWATSLYVSFSSFVLVYTSLKKVYAVIMVMPSAQVNCDEGYLGSIQGEPAIGQVAGSSFLVPLNLTLEDSASSSGCRETESPASPFPGYKDLIAKPAPTANPLTLKKKCPGWMVVGTCTNGHRYAKELYCGREWCPICGAQDSSVHQRRKARLIPKLQQLSEVGYFVVEFPDRYRKLPGYVYSRKGLQSCTNKVVDALAGVRSHGKRQGGFFPRGILRWHFFGEEVVGKWNPHLNIIVEAGYIPENQMLLIKNSLKKSLRCKDLIVNYSYTAEIPKVMHILRYITRATFTDKSWDDRMADHLFGFRNTRWWGNWKQEAVWHLETEDTITALESGICPQCGEKITWGKTIDIAWIQLEKKIATFSGGYFQLDNFSL